MTCVDIQQAISSALDGEDAPDVRGHLASCAECGRFEAACLGVAETYRAAVLASDRVLRKLDAPRARPRFPLALAAALLLAAFALPSSKPAPEPKAAAPIAIEIPDLPASLRGEMDVDLLAVARDLPLRLGDPWPADEVLPRSVAE
ncbi:MAG TPA: hypothetical protein VF950_04120 [Planctomycetota bacterium]